MPSFERNTLLQNPNMSQTFHDREQWLTWNLVLSNLPADNKVSNARMTLCIPSSNYVHQCQYMCIDYVDLRWPTSPILVCSVTVEIAVYLREQSRGNRLSKAVRFGSANITDDSVQ